MTTSTSSANMGMAFSPSTSGDARSGPVRRWQDCDETRQQPLAVKLLIRPTSPAGPVPTAAGGQVPSKARSQSEQESRPRLSAVSPPPMSQPGQPHSPRRHDSTAQGEPRTAIGRGAARRVAVS